jgi:hypothetical protein
MGNDPGQHPPGAISGMALMAVQKRLICARYLCVP